MALPASTRHIEAGFLLSQAVGNCYEWKERPMDEARERARLQAMQKRLETDHQSMRIEPPNVPPRVMEALMPRPPAQGFQRALSQSVARAEQALQDDEILAVYHTGSGEPIFLHEVDYELPDLIILKGADVHNNRCTVLVNMHAVQIVLKAVKRPTHIERRPIGFATS